jgi:hypothetical protein
MVICLILTANFTLEQSTKAQNGVEVYLCFFLTRR